MDFPKNFALVVCILCVAFIAVANNSVISLSPVNGSEWQSTQSRIIIHFNENVPNNLNIQIFGSYSGAIPATRYITSDKKILVLTPNNNFEYNETVTVDLYWASNSVQWSFSIRPLDPPDIQSTPQNFSTVQTFNQQQSNTDSRLSEVSLPTDFPLLTLNMSGTPDAGNQCLESTYGLELFWRYCY